MSRSSEADIASVILGYRTGGRAEPQVTGPQIGKVTKVGPAGVSFTVEDYDGGRHVFGPARWHRGAAAATAVADHGPHTHAAAPPPVGAECLVVFVGDGIDKPWVVAWW